MSEIFYYLFIVVLVLFTIRIFFDLRRWVIKFIENKIDKTLEISTKKQEKEAHDRFQIAYISLEKEIERKFFDLSQNYYSEIKNNSLAKNVEVLQTKAETPPKRAKDFWQDLDSLREMSQSISQGNQSDYREIERLSDLPPLDAWREIDTAIANLESQHLATLGVESPQN